MNGRGPDVRHLEPEVGTSRLPFVGLKEEEVGMMLRVEFIRRKNSGLIYTPKRSNSLASGSFVLMTGPQVVSEIPGTDGQWERVVIEELVNPATTPRSFVTVELKSP